MNSKKSFILFIFIFLLSNSKLLAQENYVDYLSNSGKIFSVFLVILIIFIGIIIYLIRLEKKIKKLENLTYERFKTN